MSIEPRRLCGFRKVGGLYLVGRGMAMRCDRLPFPLNVCPTCRAGFKPARGWAWLDICALAGVHPACTDRFPCVFCMAPQVIGRCGLLWVGEKFYPTPDDFAREAMELGISRRIAAVPREFKLGETWVLLAHRRAVDCPDCGSRPADGIWTSGQTERCRTCQGFASLPGIFYIFKPTRIEKIVTESQARDSEEMDKLQSRGIVPVRVPDSDTDHAAGREEGSEANLWK